MEKDLLKELGLNEDDDDEESGTSDDESEENSHNAEIEKSNENCEHKSLGKNGVLFQLNKICGGDVLHLFDFT